MVMNEELQPKGIPGAAVGVAEDNARPGRGEGGIEGHEGDVAENPDVGAAEVPRNRK